MPLTHKQFAEARHKLGLSVSQAALMLGVEPLQIRRIETSPEYSSHRPVTRMAERLLQAYLDGYRPDDWPK